MSDVQNLCFRKSETARRVTALFLVTVLAMGAFTGARFVLSAAVNVTATVQITVQSACSDGLDNDGDGLYDYPNDPGCSDPTDTDETNIPPSPPAGGGGGGGGYVPPPIIVNFSGRAYPRSLVTLLKDAGVAVTTVAGQDANFKIQLTSIAPGTYLFSVYGEDNRGNRSALLTFPVNVVAGTVTNVSNIYLAPTIAVDKEEVKKGNVIAVFGQSVPLSEITIGVNSQEDVYVKAPADQNGVYLYNLDTIVLELGQHYARSKSTLEGFISPFSKSVGFKVGTQDVYAPTRKCRRADLNCDGRVNLVDFSIAAYWYKRTLSPAFAPIEKNRLNGDGKIDLVDFSIMAFYWTG